MMRLIRIFVLLLVPCYAYAQPSSAKDYELVRQDERIFMYERWADFPGTTTKSRGLKVIFTVSATFERMLTMVTEEAKIKEWQKNLAEFKQYPKNDTAWHVYSWYKMPWPLTDQDYYSKYNVIEKTAHRVVITFAPAINDTVVPARDKINRMRAHGKWIFEKTTSGKTKVTYFITGEPVNLPRSVTDNIVRNNFMSTMNELIAVAEK